jgi:8-oxo-dGTP pyrophosphatase MutT (NUDIX family)
MGYIEDLRKVIGHRPILLVGAAVLVRDPQGRLLLGLRADNHQWGIPGGAMEPGETVEETARREALEETGLALGDLRLFGVFSGPEFFYTYPNGDQVHNVSIVYETQIDQPSPQLNAEHTAWRFFAPTNLPAEISQPVRPVIRAWRNNH